MVVLWYLSAEGRETKPALAASFFIMAVKRADSTKEPASNIIVNNVNVSILAAPVVGS